MQHGKTLLATSILLSLNLVNPADASPSTFSVLHNFDSTNGANPTRGVTQAADGSLYGTTTLGGNGRTQTEGLYQGSSVGTLYKLDSNNNFSILYDFNGLSKGGDPDGGVILTADGSLLGTTYTSQALAGVAYKLDASGTYSVLTVGPGNHDYFSGKLALASDGSLYGSVTGQSANQNGYIYKLDPNHTFTEIHNFTGQDGSAPKDGVTLGPDGSLYGTTTNFGDLHYASAGSVFKITAAGVFSTLHFFDDASAGIPDSQLILANDGSLYGVTLGGGGLDANGNGYGALYKIAANGIFSLLHTFDATGYSPVGLTLGNDGSFYGAAQLGGKNGYGIIYKLDPNGNYSVLHDFTNTDGDQPNAVAIGQDGNLYGTTYSGGQLGYGTIFRLSQAPTQAVTSTTLSASNTTATQGQAITFKATVAATTGQVSVPTGTVNIEDNGTLLGTATLNAGVASYSSTGLNAGTHSITANYAGDSSHTSSTSAAVSITITAVTKPPIAVNQAFTLDIDKHKPVTIAAPGLLTGDSAPSHKPLSVAGTSSSTPRTINLAHGSVALYADGHFIYTPDKSKATCNETVTFTYQVTDGTALSNTATVKLNLTD